MSRNSFFSKLNTLVRSQINDLVDFDKGDDDRRRRVLSRREIGRGLSNDVTQLRKRIDDALDYQDKLQAKINNLYQEVADWDEKADAAVQAGREAEARFAVGRMQQAQRELEMEEAALREHRFVTQELISQVNQLEAVVEQGQREQAEEDSAAGRRRIPIDREDDDEAESIAQTLSRKLDDTRQKLSDLINTYSEDAQFPEADSPIVDEVPQPKSSPPAPRPPVDNRRVDDDLAARLSRLSKPSDDDDKK